MANLMAYIYGTKFDIHKRASALQTTRGLLHRLKTAWTWSTNGFKVDHSFYPPSVNSAFHFIARLRWRRSANGTQPHFVKWWTVGCANNVPQKTEKSWGRPSRKKLGAKNFYICSVFRWLRDLMANICWTKRDIDNQTTAWKVRRVSYVVAKFHEHWSTNGLKSDWSFYPPSLFCFVPVHRTPYMRHERDAPQLL